MNNKIKEILALLKEENENDKKKILLECASRIGSDEWKENVKEWMERLDRIN